MKFFKNLKSKYDKAISILKQGFSEFSREDYHGEAGVSVVPSMYPYYSVHSIEAEMLLGNTQKKN